MAARMMANRLMDVPACGVGEEGVCGSRLVFTVAAAEAGTRLDRFLAEQRRGGRRDLVADAAEDAHRRRLCRRRCGGGDRCQRQGARRTEDQPRHSGAAAGRAAGREPAARRRLRGRAPHHHRQARRARRPSRCRPCDGHARQRADRPLRRQPVGDRRRAAAGHRPPARQGHLGPARRRQERRRPPRPDGAFRRSRPQPAVTARISGLRLGGARPRGGDGRCAARPPCHEPRETGGRRAANAAAGR